MATNEQKVDAECRSFQDKWTSEFFLLEVKGKTVRLVGGDALAVKK